MTETPLSRPNISSDNPDLTVRLLHLSDIHFGSFHMPRSPATPEHWAEQLAEEIGACLEIHGMENSERTARRHHQFDCLILGGDLTTKSEQEGFDAAVLFTGMARQSWWSARDVLLIPGNHDVHLGEKPDPRLSYTVPVEKKERERKYRETYRKITQRDDLNPQFMGVLLHDDVSETALVGLDSCRVEAWDYRGIGYVGYDQIAEIMDNLRHEETASQPNSWRRLVFLHHHVLTPGQIDDAEAARDHNYPPELFRSKETLLADQKDIRAAAGEFAIDFLFHGHYHVPDPRCDSNAEAAYGRVIAAGSTSVDERYCNGAHQFYVYELTEGASPEMVVHDFRRKCEGGKLTEWTCKSSKMELTPRTQTPALSSRSRARLHLSRQSFAAFDSYRLAAGCLQTRGRYPLEAVSELVKRLDAAWKFIPETEVSIHEAVSRLLPHIQRERDRLLKEFEAHLAVRDIVTFERFMLQVILRNRFHKKRRR